MVPVLDWTGIMKSVWLLQVDPYLKCDNFCDSLDFFLFIMLSKI